MDFEPGPRSVLSFKSKLLQKVFLSPFRNYGNGVDAARVRNKFPSLSNASLTNASTEKLVATRALRTTRRERYASYSFWFTVDSCPQRFAVRSGIPKLSCRRLGPHYGRELPPSHGRILKTVSCSSPSGTSFSGFGNHSVSTTKVVASLTEEGVAERARETAQARNGESAIDYAVPVRFARKRPTRVLHSSS